MSRALWNGSSLLLMPAEGESDFVVVDIGSETLLGHHIIGEAVAVPREAGLPLDAREPRPETTPADAPPTVTQTPAAAQKKSSS